MSELFTRVALGTQVVQLRVTPRFRWRRATLENPDWISGTRDTDLRLACLIWCMLDGEYKSAGSVQAIFDQITDANRKELWDAVSQAWELANPKAGEKNEQGSTNSPQPSSS